MKVLLKFTILCAWLLFVTALWNIHHPPASQVAGRALPVSGWLSISRKMTDSQVTIQPPTELPSMAWPTPELYLAIPTTGL